MTSADAERFVKNWNRIHGDTSRVLRAAPDSLLEWRPKDGMFTMRELVGHIPQAELVLARSALAGSTQKIRFDFSDKSANEIADLFDRQHDELSAEVINLTTEQCNEEVEFHGRHLRRIALLWFITEHEIHHRGQLFTYYRLADVEAPNLHE
ncbi:MAG TPA: DinB family protein [Blastocatellia bacterium]|nr:DinB family protein [Blastocatellia bacterium]